jgi:hypothetical protein
VDVTLNGRRAPFAIPPDEGFSTNDSGSVKREYVIGGSGADDTSGATVGSSVDVGGVLSPGDGDAAVSLEEDSLSFAHSALVV